MLNNFLWTFAKFKTWNFAFSGTRRLGLNLVFGRDFGWWTENRIQGDMERAGDCQLYSASRPRLFSSFPHEHFWPGGPSSGPWLGSKTRVSLSGIIQPWLRARDLAPVTGRNLGWTKTKAAAANLGWQLLTKFTFSPIAARFVSPKWRNKCQFEKE